MATIRFLVPDGTTNYIKNPQLRNDTTGFAAVGASIDRTLARARFGIASLSVETVGSAINEGAYYRVNGLRDVSEAITASVYVRGEGKVRLRLIDNPNGKQWVSDEIFLNDIAWKRVEVSGFTTGSNDVRLYIETSDTQTITFYADGFQLERKPYATTYCDGEQPGCYWNGTYNSSYSTRYADTREGGRWVSPMDDKDVYITTVGGLGVAPIRNNIQPYADAPGSYYQNNKIQNRVWTVLFHVKHPQLVRMSNKNSLEKLHGLRQTLFNIFQPDKTAGGQEILVEYQDGPKPLYFRARYDSGFEGEWDVRNGFIQSFPVRFLIVSPLFFNDSYEVASLSIRNRETVNYVLQRYAGEWRSMNGGMDGNILNFAIGRNGEIYAVGEFIHANNSTSATDPQIFANFIAYWDGDQWQQVGSGANGFIYDIAVGANGYVYVVGDFTSIGGVAANRIAYWNGSSWNAMSTGFNDIAYGIAVDANGNVFAGGAFTTAGGSSSPYVSKWNGVAWSNCGVEGGLNATVRSIAITADGTEVYLGGEFTDEYGDPGNLTLNYVAQYDPSTNQFYEVGDGFNDIVLKVSISPSGRLYACGQFTESGAVSPETLLYIAYFNGTAWYAVGIGGDGYIRNMHIADDETIIVVGDFLVIGAVDSPYVAYWNKSTWVAMDVGVEAACYAVIRDRFGNVYLSTNTTLADYGETTTIENVGTAEVSPVLYFKGPCTIKWIENQTSKKRMYLDLQVLDGEEVFLDFGTGTLTSTVRGSLSFSIQVASDVRSWTLLPGSNTISVFVSTDIGALFQIGYTPLFWSVDSTTRLESL